MARKDHVSETPATQLLKAHKVDYTEHPYEYLEHGGAQHSAQALGWDPYTVVKTWGPDGAVFAGANMVQTAPI